MEKDEKTDNTLCRLFHKINVIFNYDSTLIIKFPGTCLACHSDGVFQGIFSYFR